ncbi:YceD family protein [Aquisalimonas lutea]|uniref:YceD family protein n=1 Tax=Aquisalimonas lutea TaxID=1327750 RepID=UPI0025B3DD68|nr:YceD family protein [Aquisalimonas lutea]MDN3518468.1 YceD family protein [Aquisalimonas lutea]
MQRFDSLSGRGYHARLMVGGPLIEPVDPAVLARQGKRISTVVALASLERLLGLLADDRGEVEVELTFREDRGRRAVITGTVRAAVTVVCQRCLEPMVLELEPQVNAAILEREDEADDLPDELDPVVCSSGELVLAELVQDELILALPVIARHENDPVCRPLTAEEPGGDGARRDNPFAALTALKGRVGQDDSS